MKISGKTDAGMVREINQDYFAYKTIGMGTLAILCDGMGGTNAGDVASRLAADRVIEEAALNLTESQDFKEIRNQLRSFMGKANREIFELSLSQKQYQGMGTTAVLVYVLERRALFMNIGDSRGYLISGETITRVTSDHSMVEQMVKQGHLTEEQARIHPNKNIITMALGPEETILPNSYEIALAPGDIVLLCSDGLSNMLSDEAILDIVLKNKTDVGAMTKVLIDSANISGGQDNITAVVLSLD